MVWVVGLFSVVWMLYACYLGVAECHLGVWLDGLGLSFVFVCCAFIWVWWCLLLYFCDLLCCYSALAIT